MIRANRTHRRGLLGLTAAAILSWSAGCTSDPGSSQLSATAASNAVPSSTSVDEQILRSDALIDALAADAPGCSAAAGLDGTVVWAKARGIADLAAGTPLTTATKLDVASVSKQFTATAILLLGSDGRLAVGQPISAQLPAFSPWAESVMLADLMHHTSGIPEVMDLWFDRAPVDDQPAAVDAIAAVEQLEFKPGSQWAYSNSNYVLLAEIVAASSGQGLAEFLDERVFTPLDLDMTFQPDRDSEIAVGYTMASGGWQPAQTDLFLLGPGGVVTTPTELVRWADNYRTGAVGGPQLLDGVTRDAVAVDDGTLYGAGIMVSSNGILLHNGEWAGQQTYFAVAPDRHRAIALSCNRYDVTLYAETASALQAIWFDNN